MKHYTKRIACGCTYTSYNSRLPVQMFCCRCNKFGAVQFVGFTAISQPNSDGNYVLHTVLGSAKPKRRPGQTRLAAAS